LLRNVKQDMHFDGFFETTRQRNIIMRFRICNVRSLYRTGKLRTGTSEIGSYKIHLVKIREVKPQKFCNMPADDFTYF